MEKLVVLPVILVIDRERKRTEKAPHPAGFEPMTS